MSAPNPVAPGFDLGLKAEELTRTAINAIRIAMGVTGAAALVLGVLILFWPGRTLAAGAFLFGLYFLISGVVRIATGIFASGVGGGMRALQIILGVLLLIGGVLAVKNSGAAAAVMLIMLAAIIGIGWIIEGIVALAESGAARNRGVAIVLGILSVVAGLVVLFLPGTSIPVLLIFGAISLIVLGITHLVRAFTFGREALKAVGGSGAEA